MTQNVQELLTLENLSRWVSEQPPDKKFDYVDNSSCGIAQFLTAQGLENAKVSAVVVTSPEYCDIPIDIRHGIAWMMHDKVGPRRWAPTGDFGRLAAMYSFGEFAAALEKAKDMAAGPWGPYMWERG